jgi:hypothetical protein
VVANRLALVKSFTGAMNAAVVNHRRRELVNNFLDLSKNREVTKDDFNLVMVWLYNWADTPVGEYGTQRACWIITQ